MTHHEKLVERYEDALFALMMEDVAETEGEKLQELNEQLKRDPSAEIPRELDERCIRTIRTEFGKKNFISARRGAVRVFRVDLGSYFDYDAAIYHSVCSISIIPRSDANCSCGNV